MIKCFLGRQPHLWIHSQQPRNEVLDLIRARFKLRVVEVKPALLDFRVDVKSLVALERHIPTHEQIEQHADGPHVNLGGVVPFV